MSENKKFGITWWDHFIEIYTDECAKFPLDVILEAFYVFMGCSTQFAVKEVWRKWEATRKTKTNTDGVDSVDVVK